MQCLTKIFIKSRKEEKENGGATTKKTKTVCERVVAFCVFQVACLFVALTFVHLCPTCVLPPYIRTYAVRFPIESRCSIHM